MYDDDFEIIRRKEQIREELDEFAEDHPELNNTGARVKLLQYMNDNNIKDFDNAYTAMNGGFNRDNVGEAIDKIIFGDTDSVEVERKEETNRINNIVEANRKIIDPLETVETPEVRVTRENFQDKLAEQIFPTEEPERAPQEGGPVLDSFLIQPEAK